MDRIEKSTQLHHKGFNCAQAVVLAYYDLFDIDEKTAMRAAEGFGFGMGAMATTCGALSGAVMLAGLKSSDGNLLDGPKSKKETYSYSKQLVSEFESRCGAINCHQLKSGQKVSCDECILCAAKLVEEILLK